MDNKSRVLQALIEQPNITAAAKETKLSRRTLYNYLNDSDFRAELKRQREAVAVERWQALSAARDAALQTIVGLANDEGTPAAARVMAAKVLLQEATAADLKLDSLIQSADFQEECF